MTEQHFQSQMGRLSGRWKGAYVPELVQLIWKETASLEDESFTRMVDGFIGCARYAPLIPEIREEAAKEREFTWNRTKHTRLTAVESNSFQCSRCAGGGIIFVAAKAEPLAGPYVFKCSCGAGRADRRSYPNWDSAAQSQYNPWAANRVTIESLPGVT